MLYIVLLLEVLYYSTFFKVSKKKGSLIIFISIFTLSTLGLYLLDNFRLLGYLAFILISVIGMKLLTKSNDGAFDILLLLIAMLIKLIFEPFCFIPYLMFNDIYISTIIISFVKIVFLILFDDILNLLYKRLLDDWNNNKFYIRYIASISLMLYVIATCILMIVNLI